MDTNDPRTNPDPSKQTTRRHFIQSSLGCVATLALSPNLGSAAESSKPIPIGFQLYTVRGEFERDVPGTLKTIAEIGYKGVEFWAYAGTRNVYQNYSAIQLRQLLDQNGLKCCGMHVSLEAFADKNLKQTMENSHVLGGEYINLASATEHMKSEKGIAELAALLNRVSDKFNEEKLVAGYHSHGFDFAKINDHPAWELLFKQTKPEVNMQLDVGNALDGGGDPIAMLKEFPGRTRTTHIKEHEDKTFDSPFYKEIFQLFETKAGTKWYIVEMGTKDGTGFDIPRQALAKLRSLGK
jgi:sugar phosphate isomerase/epimerase